MLTKAENTQKAMEVVKKAALFLGQMQKLKAMVEKNLTILDPVKTAIILKDISIFHINLDCILGQNDFPQIAEIDKHINFVRVVETRLKSVYGKKFEEAFAARVLTVLNIGQNTNNNLSINFCTYRNINREYTEHSKHNVKIFII